MANKKDLVEAQTFSRRRLLTAFVSGAPGGRELEPTKPLRAVVAGVALTALLVIGSLVFGLLRPGLPQGWDHNSLIVTTSAGSRYVALDGTLYPILNTASARLLISGEFRVIQVDDAKIAATPRGQTRGIPGAPDDLPTSETLIDTGWLACVEPGGGLKTIVTTGDVPAAVDADLAARAAGGTPEPGILVTAAGDQFLVTGGRRHLVPRDQSAAVLRAIGLDTVVPWTVSGQWLNLFPPGADLDPIAVDGVGGALPAAAGAPPEAMVGSIVSVTDTGRQYAVSPAGELAPLSAFALPLYRLGAGSQVGPDIEVTAAQVAGMPTAAQPAGGQDWPTTAPVAVPDGQVACASLTTDVEKTGAEPQVHLVSDETIAMDVGVQVVAVQPAGGALVRSIAGTDLTGPALLIDQTGTAFALPDTSDDLLTRLGYTADDFVDVPQPWAALFPVGPALSIEAAGQVASTALAPGAG